MIVSPTVSHGDRRQHPIVLLAAGAFLATFSYALLLSFHGVDVTDTGFHLTNQVQAFADAKHPMTQIFMTDYLGGPGSRCPRAGRGCGGAVSDTAYCWVCPPPRAR